MGSEMCIRDRQIWGQVRAGDVRSVLETLAGAFLPEDCFERISYCVGYVVGATVLSPGAAGATARVGRVATRLVTGRVSRNLDWNVQVDNTGLCGAVFSFSGDTEVLMASGDHVSFEELDYGDMVWAHDPVTGETGPRPVVGIWPHLDAVFDVDGAHMLCQTAMGPIRAVVLDGPLSTDDFFTGFDDLSGSGLDLRISDGRWTPIGDL